MKERNIDKEVRNWGQERVRERKEKRDLAK